MVKFYSFDELHLFSRSHVPLQHEISVIFHERIQVISGHESVFGFSYPVYCTLLVTVLVMESLVEYILNPLLLSCSSVANESRQSVTIVSYDSRSR